MGLPIHNFNKADRLGSYLWLGRVNGATITAGAALANSDDLSNHPPRGLWAQTAGNVDVVLAEDDSDTTVTVALLVGDNPLSIKTMIATNGITVYGAW